jgi:4a-hydroxytetrahydrobiopterin dehydratase
MSIRLKQCEVITDGKAPLTRRQVLELSREIPKWSLLDGHLRRTFTFSDFRDSMQFVKELAILATEQCHAPDITIREGRFVEVSLFTYPCGGLTENDFILAAKIDDEIRANEVWSKGQ